LTEASTVSTTADFRDNYPNTYVGNIYISLLFFLYIFILFIFDILDCPYETVGRPYPGGEIQIRDPETFEVLAPNERGEVCVKGKDFIFNGYYKNPEVCIFSIINTSINRNTYVMPSIFRPPKPLLLMEYGFVPEILDI
jgi:acyl-CoA synthetase (AMP-forming)/AMP-acid ligase II